MKATPTLHAGLLLFAASLQVVQPQRKTLVAIVADKFHGNGLQTY